MFISLSLAKKHLNIDQDFIEDDPYIIGLISVAEEAISRDTGRELGKVVDDEGNLPSCLRQAALLLVGTLYLHRETVDSSNIKELPLAYNYLLDLWRSYDSYC